MRKFKGIAESLGTGLSHDETLLLLNAGYDVAGIAETKGIKPRTVYTHIVSLIRQDKLTDFSTVITREQYTRVMTLARENPDKMWDILEKELPDGLPNVALAISDFLLRQKEKK
ncbi:helix-turn-helix domain-containing protein [uncultured Duncaniella sp.]|uniref:helix-turn-helix domain-containing protein n=1 Tax=uncultured Duncaniella sp. TaxID=2768039 RepID=UPI00260AFAA1|nr:helix-turn-helix domain-containing protein [uncultured Duncaniella sp.]